MPEYPCHEGDFPFKVMYRGQSRAEATLDRLAEVLRGHGDTDRFKIGQAADIIQRYFDYEARHRAAGGLPSAHPEDFRVYSGCTHALHERCARCQCPTCGTDAIQVSVGDGPKFWLTISSLFTHLRA